MKFLNTTLLTFFFCCTLQGVVLEGVDSCIISQDLCSQLYVPKHPLSSHALAERSICNDSLELWTDEDHLSAFHQIQEMAKAWKDQQYASNYLIFAQILSPLNKRFKWHLVAYPENGWHILKQLNVLWGLTVYSPTLDLKTRKEMAQYYRNELLSPIENPQEPPQTRNSNDAFCNSKVIQKQLVFEGRFVYLLYNYAPLDFSPEKLHFLIVPKAHRKTFLELSDQEWLETSQISQALIKHYQEEGFPLAFLFNKNGKAAGQTVAHWHQQVVFTATTSQALRGKIKILSRMIFGPKVLSDQELKQRVEHHRQELSSTLQKAITSEI